MDTPPTFVWSAAGGLIDQDGLFTAPNASVPATVTASNRASGGEFVVITNSEPVTALRTGYGWTTSLLGGALGDPSSSGQDHLDQLTGQTDITLSSSAGSYSVSPTDLSAPDAFVPPSLTAYHYHPDQTSTETVTTVSGITYDEWDYYEIDIHLTVSGSDWTYLEVVAASYTIATTQGSVELSSGSGSYGYTFDASGGSDISSYTCTVTASASASGTFTDSWLIGTPVTGTWTQTTENTDVLTNDMTSLASGTGTASRSGSGSTTYSYSGSGSYSSSGNGGTMSGTTVNGSNTSLYRASA